MSKMSKMQGEWPVSSSPGQLGYYWCKLLWHKGKTFFLAGGLLVAWWMSEHYRHRELIGRLDQLIQQQGTVPPAFAACSPAPNSLAAGPIDPATQTAPPVTSVAAVPPATDPTAPTTPPPATDPTAPTTPPPVVPALAVIPASSASAMPASSATLAAPTTPTVEPHLPPANVAGPANGPLLAPGDRCQLEIVLRDASGRMETLPGLPQEHEYVIAPDGKLHLGRWGNVSVVGLTPEAAAAVVRRKLTAFTQVNGVAPSGEVWVRLLPLPPAAPVHILYDTPDGPRTASCSWRDGMTVFDAIAQTPELANHRIPPLFFLRRGSKTRDGNGPPLLVDWQAMTDRSDTRTNHRLQPGDCLDLRSSTR